MKAKVTNLHPLEVRDQNPMGKNPPNPFAYMAIGHEIQSNLSDVMQWQKAEAALKTYKVIDSEAEDFADQFFTDDNQIVNRPYGYTDAQVAQYRGIVQGYNKAKEKYKFTEEDMRKCFEDARAGKVTTKYNGADDREPLFMETWRSWDDYSKSLSPYKLGQEVDCIVNQDGETCKIIK